MSDYFPPHVLVQILLRLPPKSVIKLKCVSKSWNEMISDPSFISKHVEQSSLLKPTSEHFMVRYYSKTAKSDVYSVHWDDGNCEVDETFKIEYPFGGLTTFLDFTEFYHRIVGSCNGVLCLSDDKFGYKHTILLWNPSIRREVIVPLAPSFSETEPHMFILGFGYDEKRKDYKIVRIVYLQDDSGYLLPPKVEIYMAGVGNWRVIDPKGPVNFVVEYFWTQAFLNGNVHWVAYKKLEGTWENLIMVFNMTDEVFEEVKLPSDLPCFMPINLNVGIHEESLALFIYDDKVWSKRCSIWVMEQYGNPQSWRRKFDIHLSEGLGMVLGFRKNGHILLTNKEERLLSYNPSTRTITDVGVVGVKGSFFVDAYVESLGLFIEGKEAKARIRAREDSDDVEMRVINQHYLLFSYSAMIISPGVKTALESLVLN